ncbi:MAG: EthD family reductase [Acidobacteria bacterium]|nr:EthD family reductase [Acidobacteriota bacterium]
MIKVSVFYPNSQGCKFDMAYYLKHHMPLVQRLLGTPLKGMAVEEGLAGGAPGVPPTYVALGHLYFDSVETFQSSFGENADAILNDIPNYSNVQPTIQISEVKL